MATKRPTRRRKELVIEPLNWVAPDAREDQRDKRVEKDEVEQDDKKMAKS